MAYSNPAAYEQFMGRWSARLAVPFAEFAGIRPNDRVLDVGCGTGILSRALLDLDPGIAVVGIDPVASYVDFASRAAPSARAQFRVGTAEMLPVADGSFDAALALLILQELADPPAAVREMARTVRRGGCVAGSRWDFIGGVPMLSLFWEAAQAIAPDAVARHRVDRSARRDYPGPEDLATLWRSCGLTDVRTAVLDITMQFASFDDYWLPFLGGATPTCAFARDLNETTGGEIARLLSKTIGSQFGGGSFTLPARAFAAAGVVGG